MGRVKNTSQKILPRMTRTSILVFDEFCHRKFPGEVQAAREVLDLMSVDVSRSEFQSHCAILRFR
jgi:hypothetical protein